MESLKPFAYNPKATGSDLIRKSTLADKLNALWFVADTIEKQSAIAFLAIDLGLDIRLQREDMKKLKGERNANS